jgi:hypothetical protein
MPRLNLPRSYNKSLNWPSGARSGRLLQRLRTRNPRARQHLLRSRAVRLSVSSPRPARRRAFGDRASDPQHARGAEANLRRHACAQMVVASGACVADGGVFAGGYAVAGESRASFPSISSSPAVRRVPRRCSVLNDWLSAHALANQTKGFTGAIVVCDAARVVGFYGLAPTAVPPAVLSRRLRTGRPPDPIPSILFGQLAVDRAYAGRGIGSPLSNVAWPPPKPSAGAP